MSVTHILQQSVIVFSRLLLSGGERIWQIPIVKGKALVRRDRYQCQYSSSRQKLTIDSVDSVILRSQGGKHNWDDVVIAYVTCNSRQGSPTSIKAGMFLKKEPKPPVHPTITFAEKFWSEKQL